MNGSLVAHMTEQNGIVGPDHYGKHPPPVGGGPPAIAQDDDVGMGEGPVLQIPDNPGKLHQFLLLVPFALGIGIHGESQKNYKPQQ